MISTYSKYYNIENNDERKKKKKKERKGFMRYIDELQEQMALSNFPLVNNNFTFMGIQLPVSTTWQSEKISICLKQLFTIPGCFFITFGNLYNRPICLGRHLYASLSE